MRLYLHHQKELKKNESDAYRSSLNAETNDDKVHPIEQKTVKTQLKRKGKAKETAKKRRRRLAWNVE